jgi:phage terminase Nu1 subunit (DNA packaging protein)
MAKLLETMSDVAFALGVSKQTVSDWKVMGCPHLKRKPFDLDKIAKWQKDNIEPSQVRRKRSEDNLELIERKRLAETEIKELQVRTMRWESALNEGRLVWAEDWERALNTQAESFRKALLSVKYRWAAKLVGLTQEQAETLLDEIAEDVLRVLHKGDS